MNTEKDFTGSLRFAPMSPDELKNILDLTIKKDGANKLITFLCMLSAYTEDSQFNISFIAPSSTGKSYIPTEVSKLFPEKDISRFAVATPTSFFYTMNKRDKNSDNYFVDLSRRIIIFPDQPNPMLLEKLRSILSHDQKISECKITNKNKQGGNCTMTAKIIGFPAVIFCSAGLMLDEQEGTRFLLLSPETSQDKIRMSVTEKIKKEAGGNQYRDMVENDERRNLLKERVVAIREEMIDKVIISNPTLLESMFFKNRKKLRSRNQRDIGHIISLIKSLALLNLWWRERDDKNVIANDDDIKEGYKIWDEISSSQELNLPPFLYAFYSDIILPLLNERGFTNRNEVVKKYSEITGENLSEYKLRTTMLPMLLNAGLIIQEKDPNDSRRWLIYPSDKKDGGIEDLEEDWDKDVFPEVIE
jgi:hypothetical protein